MTTTTLLSSTTTPAQGAPVQLTVTVKAGGSPVTRGRVALCLWDAFTCSASEAFAVLQLSPSGTASTYLYGVSQQFVQAGFEGTRSYAKSYSGDLEIDFPYKNLPTTTTLTASGVPGNYTLMGKVAYYGTPTTSPQVATAPLQIVDTSNNNYLLGTVNQSAQLRSISMIAAAAPAAGTQPGYVATGDFNNDGRADLAVVNTGDNTVGILLGNGDGTFQPQVTYATGATPGPIVVADFDGDSHVDLAVLSTADKSIGVLRGNGDGTFQAQVPYPTGNNPIALASGDVDQDGLQDLVVLNHDDLTAGVLLNHGDGTFAAQVTYTTGNDPRSIAVGDANKDGITDLAVANFADNTLSLFYGTGAGDGSMHTPITRATGNGPIAVSLYDLADSGHPSIVYLNAIDGTVTVIPVDYNGTTGSATNYTTGANPTALAFGFFVSDRTPDIGVLNGDGSVSIYAASGEYDAIFIPTPATYAGGAAGAVSLADADFNGDTQSDFVVAGTSTSALTMRVEQAYHETDYQLQGVSVAGTSTSAVIAIYPGESPSFLASTSSPVSLTETPIITTTTLALNQTTDVIPGSTITLTAAITPAVLGNYSIAAGTGTVTFADKGVPLCGSPLPATSLTCTTDALPFGRHVFTVTYSGDQYFQGSSATKILYVSNLTTTTLALSANSVAQGTSVLATVTVKESVAATAVGNGLISLCDVTAPVTACVGTKLLGTIPVQSANGTAGTGTLRFFLPGGTYSIQASYRGTNLDAASTSAVTTLTVLASTTTTLSATGSNPYTLKATMVSPTAQALTGSVALADSADAGYVGSLSLGTSVRSSTFATAVQYPVTLDNDVKDIHAVDLNGDGVADLVFSNGEAGVIGVRIGVGDGTFASEVDYVTTSADGGSDGGIGVSDINGDGKPDLVALDLFSCSAYVFLGNGDGTFPGTPNSSFGVDLPECSTSPSTSGPLSITVGDYDQDGLQDLAISTYEGSIYFFKGNGDGTLQPRIVTTDSNPSYPGNLLTADLNNDGTLDLLYLSGSNFRIRLGNGDGTFGTSQTNEVDTFSGTLGMGVGDLNGDGIPDVVVGCADVGVVVFLGKGDGSFQSGVSYDATSAGHAGISTGAPWGIAIADYNGDGVEDIAAALASNYAGVGVFTGKGDGTFNTMVHYGNVSGYDDVIAAGDFNKDGLPDLAVWAEYNGTVYALRNVTTQTATATKASYTVPGAASPTPAHMITGTYSGDTAHSGSVSNSLVLTGTTIATTTTLTISPATLMYRTDTTVTASIKPTTATSYGYTMSGNVVFTDTVSSVTTTVCTVAATAVAGGNGSASCLLPASSVGTLSANHALKAVYAGDTNFKTSTSSTLTKTVGKATPVLTWTPASNYLYTGTAIGATILNASSGGVAGTFVYKAKLGSAVATTVTAATVLSTVGTYALTVTFTPTDTTDYNTATGTAPALLVYKESVWVLNSTGSLSRLYETGAAVMPAAISGGGESLAFDSSGNIWSTRTTAASVAEFTKTGDVVHAGYTGGGVNAPVAVAIDGLGNVWIANGNNSVSELTNGGAAVSPATGYTGGGLNGSSSIAIDNAGNVWVSNAGNNSVTEIVGGGAPVTTPNAVAVQSSSVGTRP